MGESFPMKGGDGGDSYANNSQRQKQASASVKEMIQEAVIQKLEAAMISSGVVAIADLGCSVGPNTFFTVQHLIEAVQVQMQKQSKNMQEIQVYFNDHTTNDFNKLFASLPIDRQYYAAGVPGSFDGRLFPRGSITLAHSAHSLHWLSQPPQGVRNEARIHYAGAPAHVVRAYLGQFERDVGAFLSARAEEMVRGGLLFLGVPGTHDGLSYSQQNAGLIFKLLQDSLLELADEGAVERDAIDGFNLPIYFPAAGEMRRVVEKNTCFSIERFEVINPRMPPVDSANVAMFLRSGMEGVFTAHFGTFVVDKMFAKVPAKAKQVSPNLLEAATQNSSMLFLVLKRK